MNDPQDAHVHLFCRFSAGFGIEQPQHLTVPHVAAQELMYVAASTCHIPEYMHVHLVVIGDKAELTASNFFPVSSIRLLRICSTTYS